ncbi:MAG: hypothetical protein MI864_05480 [Pseudomonadales bacterium]|uniref:Uncharacterized protein n=1 Tax=Oleiphilus messinensis TaxID=141451 RepID=A0A1Y0I1X9_9GAMM|nr:hypothetical protein [Oleiphilus messinensis]ARU54219.1 hypothetical protein OLMES_0110 [Oleiphilus messinensis]MCG8609968.1 hypothetical protein [Pseudomonadales bacterium]
MGIRATGYATGLLCLSIVAANANAELTSLEDGELRDITGQSALQFSATDISYELNHLVGVEFTKDEGIGFTRTEQRSVTEQVDATVYRYQINADGEFHAFAEELTLGDYGGANNSIYKDENGQGVPDVALRNFGFGKSAEEPFYFEDPYIEIQQQNHADGTQSFRGFRIGFGLVNGSTPVTIDSISGYIQALSVLADAGGLIRSQIYGSGTKDTFANVIGEFPDGSGNYAQTPPPGEQQCNGIWCGNTPDNTGLSQNTNILPYALGGKELNLEHVESLDYHNVENFYISMTQGGGASFVNADGSVNGAMWSQHLEGIIPKSRPDLPGWNLVTPFNDPNNATDGYLEAHSNITASLGQVFFGTGDDNPRQSYQPLF